MKALRGRKFGKWQKGNLARMNSKQMEKAFARAHKENPNVIKPQAIEIQPKRWRLYCKPLEPGEYWD